MCLFTSLPGARGETSKSPNVKKSSLRDPGAPGSKHLKVKKPKSRAAGHGTHRSPSRRAGIFALGTYGVPGTGPFPTRRAGDGLRCRGGSHLTQINELGSFFCRPKLPQPYRTKEVTCAVVGSNSGKSHVRDIKSLTHCTDSANRRQCCSGAVRVIPGLRHRSKAPHLEEVGDGSRPGGIRRRVGAGQIKRNVRVGRGVGTRANPGGSVTGAESHRLCRGPVTRRVTSFPARPKRQHVVTFTSGAHWARPGVVSPSKSGGFSPSRPGPGLADQETLVGRPRAAHSFGAARAAESCQIPELFPGARVAWGGLNARPRSAGALGRPAKQANERIPMMLDQVPDQGRQRPSSSRSLHGVSAGGRSFRIPGKARGLKPAACCSGTGISREEVDSRTTGRDGLVGSHLTQVIGLGNLLDGPIKPQSYCPKEVGRIVICLGSRKIHVSDIKFLTRCTDSAKRQLSCIGAVRIAGLTEGSRASHPEVAGVGGTLGGIRRRVGVRNIKRTVRAGRWGARSRANPAGFVTGAEAHPLRPGSVTLSVSSFPVSTKRQHVVTFTSAGHRPHPGGVSPSMGGVSPLTGGLVSASVAGPGLADRQKFVKAACAAQCCGAAYAPQSCQNYTFSPVLSAASRRAKHPSARRVFHGANERVPMIIGRGGFHFTQVIGLGKLFYRPRKTLYCAEEVRRISFFSGGAGDHISEMKLLTGRADGGSMPPPVGATRIVGPKHGPPGPHPEVAGDGRESDGIGRREVGGGEDVVENAPGESPTPCRGADRRAAALARASPRLVRVGARLSRCRVAVGVLLALLVLSHSAGVYAAKPNRATGEPRGVTGEAGRGVGGELIIRQVGAWGGSVDAVFVEEQGDRTIAYIGSGVRLVILDVTNPGAIIELGSVMFEGIVQDVKVRDGYAFIASEHKQWFTVVDVSDLTAPVTVSGKNVVNEASLGFNGVLLYGDIAYTLERSGNRPLAFDVSDPVNPLFSSSWLIDRDYPVTGVISGDYIYLADTNPGSVAVYDLFGSSYDPWSPPVLLGSLEIPDLRYAHSLPVAVNGNRLYVGARREEHTRPGSGLYVVDFSVPEAPFLAGTWGEADDEELTQPMGLAVSDGKLYVADWNFWTADIDPATAEPARALAVFDITTDPTSPALLGEYWMVGAATGVTAVGTTAYVQDEREGLVILDCSDPSDIVRVGGYHSPAVFRQGALDGNLLYVTDRRYGVTTLDMSDPHAPTPSGKWDTGSSNNWGIAVRNGLAYIGAGWAGLQVLDVSNPAVPSLAGAFPFDPSRCAVGVELAGDVLHVGAHHCYACGPPQLANFDVSDVQNIAEMGSVSLRTSNFYGPWSVTTRNDGVTFTGRGSYSETVDNSDPYNPLVLCQNSTRRDVHLAGGLLHVGADRYRAHGLYLFDGIADPCPATLVGSSVLDHPPFGSIGATSSVVADVERQRGYMGFMDGWLRVVDVSVPAEPSLLLMYHGALSDNQDLVLDPPYVYAIRTHNRGANPAGVAVGAGVLVYMVFSLGDFDDDGDVDLDDSGSFMACFTGADGGPVASGCVPGDFDDDGDVDCVDWDGFVDAWTEPGDPPVLAQCLDDDNDGVPNASDPAPADPDICGDSDGDTCDDCAIGTDDLGPLPDNDPGNDGPDADTDGICDAGDNCRLYNPDQADCQPNGAGDVCDIADATSQDCNSNGAPDECDTDVDVDGIPDECDNCDLYNPEQTDCQPNGVGDECDIDDGTSPDVNWDGIPDECQIPNPLILPFNPKHQARKHRYLSIDPSTNALNNVGLKVEVAEMRRCSGDLERACTVDDDCEAAVPGSGTCIQHSDVGTAGPWWVQAPQQEPLGCIPGPCGDEDWFARVAGTPYFDAWTLSTLHIGDCEMVPVATYEISACAPPDGVLCSDPLTIGTIEQPFVSPGFRGNYGDVVGTVDAITEEFTPPDGFTNVVDVSAYILTNQNYGTANKPQTHPTWVDLHGLGDGNPPQYILNVSDMAQILKALVGDAWTDDAGNMNPGECR